VAIPSKDAVQPLVLPSAAVQAQVQQAAKAQEAAQRAEQQAAASQADAAAAKAQQADQQEAQLQAQAQAQAKADQDKQAAAAAAASAAAQQAQSKQAEAARARAILEGNAVKAAGTATTSNTSSNTSSNPAAKTEYPDDGKRRVIQVGSFNDVARAREVRLRLERAGITTYTQVVTSNGARFIRVRVGPFDNAKELQRYIDRVEALNLEARVLTF
jgi:DedD protein